MSQSRSQSALEALANVVVGYCTAFALQVALFPLVGLAAGLGQHLAISAGFTLLSLLRSYALRRLFVRLG
ncbi:DUF7220 family protein [Tropicibacter sp. S64]|uniref:DUF7220 family protein n=1 Tax=Tropicibacter sp. S64 TaxID=3415122 RepID=UPI003C797F19